ncbi:MAG: peroxiredoxin family protein [Solirubrobacterales bacterium]
MDAALLVARLVLAGVFAAAAVAKLADPAATATSLSNFRVPRALVRLGTYALPLAELAIACALVPGSTAAWAAIAAAALLAGFSSAIVRILARGERVDCNCIGAVHIGPVSGWTLARDSALFGLAAFVAIAGPGDAGLSVAESITLLTAAAIAAIVLWSRSPARVASPAVTLESEFDLPDLDGTRVKLAELLAAGRGLVIVFSEPSCADCEPLFSAVARLQQDGGRRPPVIVVSRGSVEANRERAGEHGLSTVLLDEEFKLARSFGITGMPGAVVLDADGRIVEPPAVGARAVDELLGRVAATGEDGLLESIARRRSSVGRALHS